MERKSAIKRHQRHGVDDNKTKSLLSRFSGIKVDYDKERRKIVSSYHEHDSLEISHLSKDKVKIRKQLHDSLEKHNLPALYVQIILALFPQIKSSKEMPDSNALIQHLKKAFRLSNEAHIKLMDIARASELPQRIINVEIVEARDLPSMDANGFADPYCVIYLNTKAVVQRTKQIEETLNPVWNHYFTFKVNDPTNDVLHIEVMDFNEQDESLKKKVGRFKQIKSAGTLGVFIKDLTKTRQIQEHIGCLQLPVSEISSETVERWFKLKNREHKGEIYLRMALGYNKTKEAATEELLKITHVLVVHELDKESAIEAPYYWNEQYDVMWSKYILRQFKWQGGLKPKDIVLVKYRAYIAINAIFPLSPSMLCNLTETVVKRAMNNEYDAREICLFWDCSASFVDTIVKFIGNIHDELPCPVTVLHTPHMLKTLKHLSRCIQNLSPEEVAKSPFTKSIFSRVNFAVRDGANKFYCKIFADSDGEQVNEDENPMLQALEHLLKIGQLLHEDIRLGVETVHADFKEIMNVDYLTITYQVYDEEYGKMVKCLVQEYNNNLSSEELDESALMDEDSDYVKIGLSILKLYLAVKNLASFAPEHYMDVTNSKFSLKRELHNWFFPSVSNWIETLRRRVMNLVKTSITFSENDKKSSSPNALGDSIIRKEGKPGGRKLLISTTAVNTAQLFTEINKFWMSLNWEDPNQSYSIAKKILEELYGVLIYYADQLLEAQKSQRRSVANLCDVETINSHLRLNCIEMNNIYYVKDHVDVLAEQLNIPQIIYMIELTGESTLGSSLDYEENINKMKAELLAQFDSVFSGIMENCVQSTLPKLEQLFVDVSKPELWKGSCSKSSALVIDPVLGFIDKCLMTIGNNVENQNFQKVLVKFWQAIVSEIDAQVTKGLETRKTSEHFQCFKCLLGHLHSFFWPDEVRLEVELKFPLLFEKYDKEKQRLWTLGAPLEDVKFEYYSNRYKRQQTTPANASQHGAISIRVGFAESESIVFVEILNARKLKSYDKNNLSDPYAIVGLVPSESFADTTKHTTKVQYKTLCPIFDEAFKYKVTLEERQKGFLHIELFDYDFIGTDEFMGEVFFPLSDLSEIPSITETASLTQVHLAFCKPDTEDFEYLQKFEERIWDKEAQQFAKREKRT